MSPSSSQVQETLLASLLKLEETNRLSPEELEWLRGSVVRLIAEFSVLRESDPEIETSEPHAA